MPGSSIRAFSLRLLGVLATWRERQRERAQLAAMYDRDLRDIGISRVDARRAIVKPIWRA